MKKVIVILVDGMRPDALDNVPQAQEMMKRSSYTMHATTVMPSVTLPCHMSLFHNVDPARHGTTTNTYMPQVRPIEGLCEVLAKNKKRCAFFYDWSELRDLTRPGSLVHSYFYKGAAKGYAYSNQRVTDAAISYLNENETDFAFIYMGYPDEAGHNHGWMSAVYHEAVCTCWNSIDKILHALKDEYTVIVTADHGGHDRGHGTDMPEDMRIPLIMMGEALQAGRELPEANIKDIAPTVTKLMQLEADEGWEGKALI